MINPVSPWTATVRSDIDSSEPIWDFEISGYNLRLFNAGDSIWLTSERPDAGRIAFRLAFGMNSTFDDIKIDKGDEGISITASTRLGDFRIKLSFPDCPETVFRYTTSFRASFSLLIPFWPRDVVPLTRTGRIENTSGTIHAQQVGGRSGQLFFSMTKPANGSIFYFQNLTAISEYCEAVKTSLAETVGGNWPELGFRIPVSEQTPLPADIDYVISDAFVLLDQNIPRDADEVTQQFLNYLATIYLLLPKPEPVYHDWHSIAQKVTHDLERNSGCWMQSDGKNYLNAYVCDYGTPPEIMVQIAVIMPFHEYMEWKGEKHQPLLDDMKAGLDHFYDKRVNSIVRWLPSQEDDLDKSEEQKREMVMDSWYLHHPLLNLSRLGLKDDKIAKKLFLESIEYVINVAHHFNYKWPVFYKMTTLEVLKAETTPGNRGETDVPGTYVHIMLMAWKLTGEKRFLNEAIKAAKGLEGLGFDIFYQANNTAFAAGALVELYKETKNELFLKLSYCCLAGIFKNVGIWDCNYGHGKNFPNFFSVHPLNDAPYTAAYEELEVYAALHHYLQITEEIPILPSLQILISEFIKYTVGRLPFYYPPMLPEEMIADDVKTGEIKKDLWIPLEDMNDGWEKSGAVGQEVYGAGLPYGIIPRQYFIIHNLGAMGFVDYPTSRFRFGKRSVTFHINGNGFLKSKLILLNLGKKTLSTIKVEMKYKKGYRKIGPSNRSLNEFVLDGHGMVRISWS